jgi:hypothetical protein
MTDQEWAAVFDKGFPLEEPKILLPWGRPIEEVARLSGGTWHSDRFFWKSATFLQGLTYPMDSLNGVPKSAPFHRISALIGLTPKGWSDDASLHGFVVVSQHLTRLFGDPTKRTTENELGEKDLSWQVGQVNFYLNIIEQFVLKCYLTIHGL